MKRICDNCQNLQVSPGGTTETCWAKHEGSRVIIDMPQQYIDLRMEGDKQNCKRFKRIYFNF